MVYFTYSEGDFGRRKEGKIMKKLVSLLIAMVMILSISGAFADSPPHVAPAFPFGDLGGVYSHEIENSMNRVGQITNPSSYIWKGLPWQYGRPNQTGVAGGRGDINAIKALVELYSGKDFADAVAETSGFWPDFLAYLGLRDINAYAGINTETLFDALGVTDFGILYLYLIAGGFLPI